MSSAGSPPIKLDGLTKYYGDVRGVEDLTFAVDQGETFGFLGPNGAGKSTAIRVLLGLLKPTDGEARLLGRDATDRTELREAKRHLGYLPSDVTFYRRVTGARVLGYFGRLRGSLMLAGALIALIALTVGLFPSIQETGADLDAYLESLPPEASRAFVGNVTTLTTIEGYLVSQLCQFGWVLLLAIYHAYAAAPSIAGRSNADSRADALAAGDANPVRRRQVPLVRSGGCPRQRDHLPRGCSRRGTRR
ncbi:ATP-binding cassette domain-containing protein [Natrinema salifodinae]|uniref:ABC transporter n=1 Tax=Natrinema salifodinae TaxID=1202768 RepID=A0A1I0QV01_9EURY|nr:ATP-binding cassette domain-containing protein [Natrinema salifodinae]SEW31390.1 ABC transporter [Natrinema salifodinae]